MAQHASSRQPVPGETYFFRDPAIFSALAAHILPGLLRSRWGSDRQLRLWSAGCASGEEACSLAITVQQQLPAAAGWDVSILATDNNRSLLEKADAGIYGEWSFRGPSPGIKERYFDPVDGRRYAIRAEVRKLVTYRAHDLLYDLYPSVPHGFDVIVCRHVLMYFTPAERHTVVANLRRALAPGGWLIVSPAETSQEIFSDLEPVVIEGRTLYRRNDEVAAPGPWVVPPLADTRPDPPAAVDPAVRAATPPPSPAMRVRTLANEGRFGDALSECERWLAAEKLDATAHYLHGVVLAETGRAADARRALQRAVYLEPSFVLAHFALGTLARAAGHDIEARRHFTNTRRLLGRLDPREPLPESDGMPAGRLGDMLAELTRDA